MKLSFLLFIIFSSGWAAINGANGQTMWSGSDTNGVRLTQDKRIDRLIEKHILINQQKKGKKGYRVQIFFGSSKKQAMEIRASFIGTFPDHEGYVIYDVPYFKVRAGDFKTRMEAVKLQKQLIGDFPGSFIVQDRIPIF